jgi:hypothetical protein
MAYKPAPSGPVRDKTYPSEIANTRPMLVPRIHCSETPEPDDTLHGEEDSSERFNQHLREK